MNVYRLLARRAGLRVDARLHFHAVHSSDARGVREFERLRIKTDAGAGRTASRSYAARLIRPDGSRFRIATDERALRAVQQEAATGGEPVFLAAEILKTDNAADWEAVMLARRVFPGSQAVTAADRDGIPSRPHHPTPRAPQAVGGAETDARRTTKCNG